MAVMVNLIVRVRLGAGCSVLVAVWVSNDRADAYVENVCGVRVTDKQIRVGCGSKLRWANVSQGGS